MWKENLVSYRRGISSTFGIHRDRAKYSRGFCEFNPTTGSGTHVSGFKEGIFAAVKGFVDKQGMTIKGVKLSSDDVFQRGKLFSVL